MPTLRIIKDLNVVEQVTSRICPSPGVVKAFPNQSHLRFDFLRPISGSTRVARFERRKDWGSGVVHTYAKLTPGAKADTVSPEFWSTDGEVRPETGVSESRGCTFEKLLAAPCSLAWLS